MTRLLAFVLAFVFVLHDINAEFIVLPDKRNSTQGRKCDVAIACIFQNEKVWLREWIEFHRLVGVSHFYLYNNQSVDNPLEVLNPYIETGIVEYFDFPGPFDNNQEKIYEHALSLAKGHTKWVALIDSDEFIVPLIKDDLPAYLKIFPENVGAIEINWQCFGTSNLWSLFPGELLIDKFRLKAAVTDPINRWQKLIVRPEAVKQSLSPHICSYKEGYRTIRVNPSDLKNIPLGDESMQAIRVHHYVLRTKQYFYDVKLPRIKRQPDNILKYRSPIEYLETTNQVEDRSMQRFVPRLKEILFPDSQIHPHGYWLGLEHPEQHRFDAALAHSMINFFKEQGAKNIVDFGCGTADYVWAMRNSGFTCTGLDGNPNTPTLTLGAGTIQDLSQPFKLKTTADWGISLSVGSHIPKELQETFLKNITTNCKKGFILSWPTNTAEAIQQKLDKLGFTEDLQAQAKLQNDASFAKYRNDLRVFRSKEKK